MNKNKPTKPSPPDITPYRYPGWLTEGGSIRNKWIELDVDLDALEIEMRDMEAHNAAEYTQRQAAYAVLLPNVCRAYGAQHRTVRYLRDVAHVEAPHALVIRFETFRDAVLAQRAAAEQRRMRNQQRQEAKRRASLPDHDWPGGR